MDIGVPETSYTFWRGQSVVPVQHNTGWNRSCRIADYGSGPARAAPEPANPYEPDDAGRVDAWHTAQTIPLRTDCFQGRARGRDQLRIPGCWPKEVAEEWSGSPAAASGLAAAAQMPPPSANPPLAT